MFRDYGIKFVMVNFSGIGNFFFFMLLLLVVKFSMVTIYLVGIIFYRY